MARCIGWAAMVSVAIGLAPAGVQAFGADGHRVTGYVAEALLTDTARARLTALLGPLDLATLALAADEQRAELATRYPGSPRWHYDDRLVCHPDLEARDYCPEGACASAAVRRWAAVLADERAERGARATAVLFLVHLVGDASQPLHAADNNDRGGNTTRVRLPGDPRVRSLHLAWDVDFVRLALDGQTPARAAEAWRAHFAGRLNDFQRGDFEQWMQASTRRASDFAYGALPGFACDRPPTDVVDLPAAYVQRATALVPELLVEAGAHIARVLNDALKATPAATDRVEPHPSARDSPRGAGR